MNKIEKRETVEKFAQKFSQASILILTNYKGLNVPDLNSLRVTLRNSNAEYYVVKNSLAKIAFDRIKLKEVDQFLVGPTGIAIGFDDPVLAIKQISEFSSKNGNLKLKCGFLKEKLLSVAEILTISKLPPRDVLLSKLVLTMKSPISNLVFTFSAILKKLIVVLNNIKDKGGRNGKG